MILKCVFNKQDIRVWPGTRYSSLAGTCEW